MKLQMPTGKLITQILATLMKMKVKKSRRRKYPPRKSSLNKNVMNWQKDDVAGKAAYEYYKENFVLAFKGTENEYVMNNQLVRMMKNAPDIRELFW